MRRAFSSSVFLALVMAPLWVAPVHAQGMTSRPPSGPVVPRPSNIGGLPTVPLPSTGRRPTLWIPSPATNGSWYWVADAPVLNGGIVVYGTDETSMTVYREPRERWIPTAERPRWVRDTSVTPVQAWRDLIVSDVMCDNYGYCVDRVQRIRAPWVAACACYAFADGWRRIWRVE